MPRSPLSEGAYLHECAELHAALTTQLSRRPQDFAAVEKAVARVRSSGALQYLDIQAIVESPHFAAGRQFWSWPSRDEIEAGLRDQDLQLWHLPRNEQQIIRRLRKVFKTTDAVSVILRFIRPDHYGIISAPVEHVLGIQPSRSSVERYIAYLKDLRLIRDKYEFKTAAGVDQALWTLHVGVHGGILEGVDHIKHAHARDRFLRSIRVKNLAIALFDAMSRIDLADALLELKPLLAAELAALEFERAVTAYANVPSDAERNLQDIINSCAPSALRDYWHRCRHLRNAAVHGRGGISSPDLRLLIEQTRNILALTGQPGPRVRPRQNVETDAP